jgi:hypothetical protein
MQQGNKIPKMKSSNSEATEVSCTLLDKNFRKLMVLIIAVSTGDRSTAGEYHNSFFARTTQAHRRAALQDW